MISDLMRLATAGTSSGGGPSLSAAKIMASGKGARSLDILFTPVSDRPVCNAHCNGCYFMNNYSTRPDGTASDDLLLKPLRATEVPATVARARAVGYEEIFTLGTELLMAPNWKEIIEAIGDKYVNTNGELIAHRGQKFLAELADAGIEQIVITANITPSHEQLNLTERTRVEAAFREIQVYNEAHPQISFRTVATVILTTENYDRLPEMARHVHDVYRAGGVKILAFVPLDHALLEFSPSKDQLAESIAQIEALRKEYAPSEFYIQRGGTLGSQKLSAEKVDRFCPAGDFCITLRSLQDGTPVTPCIFLPTISIGEVRNGLPVVDADQLAAFKEVKQRALDADYCPAHAIARGDINCL